MKEVLIGVGTAIAAYAAVELVKPHFQNWQRRRGYRQLGKNYDDALVQVRRDFEAGLPVGFY